jgi:hypothetical protein
MLNNLIGLGLLLVMLTATTGLAGTVVEPDPNYMVTEHGYRPLRSDAVKTWYMFAEGSSTTEGILNPGDTRVATFENWWTPVSSGTQMNAWHEMDDTVFGGGEDGDGDIPVSPGNYADKTYPGTDVVSWGPKQYENTLSFYMTYSQSDNNTSTYWDTSFGDSGYEQARSDYYVEKYAGTNGWALGWTSNAVQPGNGGSGDPAGRVDMDILVHNGQYTGTIDGFGENVSNPQITQANDISHLAADPTTGLRYPVKFDDALKQYTYAANQERKDWYTANLPENLTDAEIDTIIASMESEEVDPQTLAGWVNGLSDRTAAEILAVLGYEYQDAFQTRSEYTERSSDGGVIGGLAGQAGTSGGDVPFWVDQQVIRIDLAETTLDDIEMLVVWDFGTDWGFEPGNNAQVDATPIILGVDNTQTLAHGQVYYEDPITGERTWFPENRIYIAPTAEVPEPGILAVLGMGGLGILARRRKARKAA